MLDRAKDGGAEGDDFVIDEIIGLFFVGKRLISSLLLSPMFN